MSPSWKKEMHVINYLRIIFLVNRIIVQSVWIFFFSFQSIDRRDESSHHFDLADR